MYDHILVPVATDHAGRGEAALSVAESLLNDRGKLTLLTVHEAIPSYAEAYIPDEIRERNLEETRNTLKTLAIKTTRTAKTAIVRGHAARNICDYAQDHEVDCIVLASHHPGLSDYFLGSTAAWVARHADCAVHIIR